VKIFDAGKTRMIGLPYGEKTIEHLYSPRMVEEIKEEKKWNIEQTNSDITYVKPFSSYTGTLRTDGQTERIAISISRVSIRASVC